MSKTIGIIGWKIGDNSFGCGINHLDFISQFGTPRIIMPQDDFVPMDMLYLPGGMDLNPSSYGEAPDFYTSNQDVHKQYFFDYKLKAYVDNKVPIFGVCLGFQMLAVYFKSKLTQNFHYHAQSKGRWEVAHKLYEVKNTIGVDLMPSNPKKFEVNSHHHQGVTWNNLNKGELIPIFTAENEVDADDPIVEAFIHKSLPIAAVQYHPEELRDSVSYELINKIMTHE